MFKCASWVIFLLDALAASQWTYWCLRSCCVPMSDVFDVAPNISIESDLLSPGCADCVSMICWCGVGQDDHNGKKWEVLRAILSASCQTEICSKQHVVYTQDESCCVWMQVAGVSHHPSISNESVRWCLFVEQDLLQCTTAKIASLADINRILFEGNDVHWCLFQIILGILYETGANN